MSAVRCCVLVFRCFGGLTFEAANLDHSLRYRDIFLQAWGSTAQGIRWFSVWSVDRVEGRNRESVLLFRWMLSVPRDIFLIIFTCTDLWSVCRYLSGGWWGDCGGSATGPWWGAEGGGHHFWIIFGNRDDNHPSHPFLLLVMPQEVHHVRLARVWLRRLSGATGIHDDLELYQRRQTQMIQTWTVFIWCKLVSPFFEEGTWDTQTLHRIFPTFAFLQGHAMPPAFVLAKARGKGFSGEAARRKAGLSEELIAAVKTARTGRMLGWCVVVVGGGDLWWVIFTRKRKTRRDASLQMSSCLICDFHSFREEISKGSHLRHL